MNESERRNARETFWLEGYRELQSKINKAQRYKRSRMKVSQPGGDNFQTAPVSRKIFDFLLFSFFSTPVVLFFFIFFSRSFPLKL
jgi:hypothetical protein